jgi:phosphinothricin acetyltransferase
MQLRPAVDSDLPAITAIYNEAIEERIATCDLEPCSLAERRGWFRQFGSHYPIFVGQQQGRVVSYGCLIPYSHKAGYRFSAEHSLYVAREVRGKGHGRRMLEHLIGAARRLGFHYMEGRVFPHNTASIRLHRSLGFEQMGVKREAACLDGRWTDVIILARILSAGETSPDS